MKKVFLFAAAVFVCVLCLGILEAAKYKVVAKVSSYEKKSETVIIEGGKNAGIKEGMILFIIKENITKARIQVETAYDSMSSGKVLELENGYSILEKDELSAEETAAVDKDQIISEQKTQIKKMEERINALEEENIKLKEKVARLEKELQNAKKD